jgi:hypothetical protein
MNDALAVGVRARALQPPPCLQAYHRAFLEYVARSDRAAEATIAGLRNNDADSLNRGADLTDEAGLLLDRAGENLKTLRC